MKNKTQISAKKISKALFLVGMGVWLNSCALFYTPQSTQTTQSTSTTQDINVNANAQNTANIEVLYRTLDQENSIRVFVEAYLPRIENANVQTFVNDFEANFALLENYTSQQYLKAGKLNWSEAQVSKRKNKFYFHFDIPKEGERTNALLLLEISDRTSTQKKMIDIPLSFVSTKFRQTHLIFDGSRTLPKFSNFFVIGDTLQVGTSKTTNEPIYVQVFKDDFSAATPPMAYNVGTTINLNNLKLDTSFVWEKEKPIILSKSGVYFLRNDNSAFYGLSFYVAPHQFPKFNKATDLIQPLMYITTEEEMRTLQNSTEPKKDLDRFWLKLSQNSPTKAQKTIRAFYNRVRLANLYFTTYKEGWKTDRGMIYIIFGNPNRVRRADDREVWTYTSNASFAEINFTFMRRPNQFSDDELQLVRYPEYEQIWYPYIEFWREGKNEI
ncbi:MAG: GWxTD domain-containing protein [Cytophagales bacterium]|nr:MAG: GWxTD domain-containing protein [Cytophagales bacterium]